MREVPFPTPGEILLEEFLKPMGLTQYRLAKEISVPQRRIGEIIAGKRSITADTGLRLSRFFGLNKLFWVGLQLDHDLAVAGAAMHEVLERIEPISKAPSTRQRPARIGSSPTKPRSARSSRF